MCAFVGLGLMGVPMAKNLLKAGYQLAGFDLNAEVAAKFSNDKGFHFVSSPEQAIQNANVTILMLPDSSIIDAVLWGSAGSAGIASKLSKNSYLIDMSSSSPISSKENNQKTFFTLCGNFSILWASFSLNCNIYCFEKAR